MKIPSFLCKSSLIVADSFWFFFVKGLRNVWHKGRVKKIKKIVEISTKGWVGGSGGGPIPLKKIKKGDS